MLGGKAWSGELYLSTFLGANPLKDLEIELDGRVIGTTDERGIVQGELEGGQHKIRVLEKGAALTEYSVESEPSQGADITITFTDFETKPEVVADLYNPEETTIGDPGVLQGYVVDRESNPIVGAKVRIDPISIEVTTNEEGYFRLEGPRGRYKLSVNAADYNAVSSEGFRIIANVGVVANITLKTPEQEAEEAAQEVTEFGGDTEAAGKAGADDDIPEIVVVGSYKPSTLTSAVSIERFSTAVTDAISVEELLRSGDTNLAASLKRIVGVSITGGKYAVVRGLDGRYIASTLNGNLLPSTDPFRRDVELDLFPADILGGIEIQKNFSADLPGDTTGGIIKIATRGMPTEYVNSLSGSLGYLFGVTGDDFTTYKGSNSDLLGFDDGLRKLPGSVRSATNDGLDFSICQSAGQTGCVTTAQASQLGSSLPRIYNPKTEKVGPNFGLSYALGNVYDRDYGSIGVYGTMFYDQSYVSRQDAFMNSPRVESNYVRDIANTKLNAYFVAGIQGNSKWEVTSKTIVLRDSEDTTQIEDGFDRNDFNNFDSVLLEWIERQFLAQQFQGKFFPLAPDQELDWRVGVSQTSRYSPDRRSYTYLNDSLALSTVERSYADLKENSIDLGLDYLLPYAFSDDIKTNFKFGTLYNKRRRDNELVRIGITQGGNRDLTLDLSDDLEALLTADNFNNDAFRVNARSTDTDSYDGDQDSLAGYITSETNIGEKFTAVLGVRQDNFKQTLSFPNDPTLSEVELESNELLPSLSLIYRMFDQYQFRLGYGRTVSRPNLTELAPSRFFDYRSREYIGCPTCVASIIDNFDFRAEYYTDGGDNVSIAIFTKDIADPLERSVSDGSGSATNALTYRNNRGATVSGIELDANKVFLQGDNTFNVGANISFIDSKIKLDDTGRRLEIDPSRELQGQSPFLANLQLGYDHNPSKQKVTLLINYFDDRIDTVSRRPLPSIYEKARALVNANYQKEFDNRSSISFKVKNLLDAKTQFTQAGTNIEGWRDGVELSLGYSYKF